MRKTVFMSLFIVLISVILLSLTACATYSSSSSRIAELEGQIDDLQTQKNRNVSSAIESTSIIEEITITNENEDIIISVIDKISVPQNIQNNRFYDTVELVISITNNTDNSIRGIEGIIEISDLFGKTFFTAQCDLVGQTIAPGDTVINDNLEMQINQFMNDHVKLYTTDYSDLQFEYTISQVV